MAKARMSGGLIVGLKKSFSQIDPARKANKRNRQRSDNPFVFFLFSSTDFLRNAKIFAAYREIAEVLISNIYFAYS